MTEGQIDIDEKIYRIQENDPDLFGRLRKLYEYLYDIQDWNYVSVETTQPTDIVNKIDVARNVRNSIDCFEKLTIVSFFNIRCIIPMSDLRTINTAVKPSHITVRLNTGELFFYFGQMTLTSEEPNDHIQLELLKRIQDNTIVIDGTATLNGSQINYVNLIQKQFALKFSDDFNNLRFTVDGTLEEDTIKLCVQNLAQSDGFGVLEFFKTFSNSIRVEGYNISKIQFDMPQKSIVFEISSLKRKTRSITISLEEFGSKGTPKNKMIKI